MTQAPVLVPDFAGWPQEGPRWGAEPKAGEAKTGPMGGVPLGTAAGSGVASGPGAWGWAAGSGSGSLAPLAMGRVAAQFGHTAAAAATSIVQ